MSGVTSSKRKLISGAMRTSLQMESIDHTYDALIIFGHAGGGVSFNGVIDHTYNGGKIYNIRLDDKTLNTEALLNSIMVSRFS